MLILLGLKQAAAASVAMPWEQEQEDAKAVGDDFWNTDEEDEPPTAKKRSRKTS